MESEGTPPEAGPGTVLELRRQLRAVTERLDRSEQEIETLENRTNTLVRLLDLVGRRVDRLESTK